MNFVFIQDRESNVWHFVGTTYSYITKKRVVGPRGGVHEIKVREWLDTVSPYDPMLKSPFVKKVQVISAGSEQDATKKMKERGPVYDNV